MSATQPASPKTPMAGELSTETPSATPSQPQNDATSPLSPQLSPSPAPLENAILQDLPPPESLYPPEPLVDLYSPPTEYADRIWTGPEICGEVFRFLLYNLSLLFGILMWILVALQGTGRNCLFARYNRATGESESQFCSVIIGVGVMLTVLLIVTIVCHSSVFFDRMWFSAALEGFVLLTVGVSWFAIAAEAFDRTKDRAPVEVEFVYVCGFLAGVWHVVAALFVWVHSVLTRRTGKIPIETDIEAHLDERELMRESEAANAAQRTAGHE